MIEWFLSNFKQHRDLRTALETARADARSSHRVMLSYADMAYDRRTALHRIIAQDTPKANGTVKRMVKIARDCLDGVESDTGVGS